jgi:hypothetical protein
MDVTSLELANVQSELVELQKVRVSFAFLASYAWCDCTKDTYFEIKSFFRTFAHLNRKSKDAEIREREWAVYRANEETEKVMLDS